MQKADAVVERMGGRRMVYDRLDKYLSGYLPMDYWYDEGVDIAREIIADLKPCDWEMLLEKVSTKDVEWKKKIAYCLYDRDKEYGSSLLLELLDTEDEELFEIALDSLRGFVDKEIAVSLVRDPVLISKMVKLYHDAGKPPRAVLDDLAKKINGYL